MNSLRGVAGKKTEDRSGAPAEKRGCGGRKGPQRRPPGEGVPR